MAESDTSPAGYRVLARKYRPTKLDELKGQDALVRTLRNAVASGRIAQAFLFAGVRGVGKTTTARILARILNCVGPDGRGGVTAEPCGVCDPCAAIAEDRHVDVVEMDAATHTQVDKMRELLDSARYRPVMGRYKIYVVDEVHMLSGHSFNAMLKMLEEPPEHLKFVFATTELRKIPATVLSRCQRFDLRRIEAGELAAYFADIVARENAEASEAALALIARAADGSVRDGLSILDQALAQGRGDIAEEDVREMLGLADRGLVFDLFEAAMGGDAGAALANLDRQYAAGVDPAAVLEDLLEFAHWLSRRKAAPDAARAAAPEFERVRGGALAERLAVPHLVRAWQILLKGIGEARTAPDSLQAAAMTLIRLAHSADLPTPEEALRALDGGETTAPRRPAPPSAPAHAADPGSGRTDRAPDLDGAASSPAPAAGTEAMPNSFDELLALMERKREGLLHAHLRANVHLVSYEPGKLEFRPADAAPPELARDIAAALERWTGGRWMVAASSQPGEDTVADREENRRRERLGRAAADPGVARILDAFPGAKVVDVRDAGDNRAENAGR